MVFGSRSMTNWPGRIARAMSGHSQPHAIGAVGERDVFDDAGSVVEHGSWRVYSDGRCPPLALVAPAAGFLDLRVRSRDEPAQFGDLGLAARGGPFLWQFIQRDRADRDAPEPHHFVSELGEHPADLAVLPFGQHDSQPGAVSLRLLARARFWPSPCPR